MKFLDLDVEEWGGVTSSASCSSVSFYGRQPQVIIIEREAEQAPPVHYKCDYCGCLLPWDSVKCQSCGAPR